MARWVTLKRTVQLLSENMEAEQRLKAKTKLRRNCPDHRVVSSQAELTGQTQ